MSENLNDTINEIGTTFNEFKSSINTRLSEIEKKGSADPLTSEKIDRMSETLGELEKKMQRPSTNGVEINADEAEYKSAFNKWARKGYGEHELEALEKKATTMTISGDGTQGGFALPKVVETGVYRSLEVVSPIRDLATVIQISGDDYRFLSVNGHVGAGWVGETDPRPATDVPTLAENKVPMGEIYANPFVSQRALDDLSFNVEEFLAADIAVKFAQMESTAFINGSGTNMPKGILATSGITQVKTGVAAGMPTGVAPIFGLLAAVAAPYRTGAKFVGASATLNSVRTLTDTTGQMIYQPSLVAGVASTLLGYDMVEVEDVPAVAAGSFSMIFGNFKQGYLIADRIGIRTLRDPYTNKPYVGFYATKRVGGMVQDAKAFAVLKTSA